MVHTKEDAQQEVEYYLELLRREHPHRTILFNIPVMSILLHYDNQDLIIAQHEVIDAEPMLTPYLELISQAREFRQKHEVEVAYLGSLHSGYWREMTAGGYPFVDDLARFVHTGRITSEGAFLADLKWLQETFQAELVPYSVGPYEESLTLREDVSPFISDLFELNKKISETLSTHYETLAGYEEQLKQQEIDAQAQAQNEEKRAKRQTLLMGDFDRQQAQLTSEDLLLLEPFTNLVNDFDTYLQRFQKDLEQAAPENEGCRDIIDRVATAVPEGIAFRLANTEGLLSYLTPQSTIHRYLDDVLTTWSKITQPYWVPEQSEEGVIDTAPDYIKELFALFLQGLDILFAFEDAD